MLCQKFHARSEVFRQLEIDDAQKRLAGQKDMKHVIWSLTTYLLSAIMIFGSANSRRWSGLITRALVRAENIPPRALLINRLMLLVVILNLAVLLRSASRTHS
jgi:hypothetical protein